MPQGEKLVKLRKWDNGVGILIPNLYAQMLKVVPVDQLKITVDGDKLVITPVKKRKSLAQRFAEYQGPLELAEEWDFKPVGNELDW